jgi:hypothetical protein
VLSTTLRAFSAATTASNMATKLIKRITVSSSCLKSAEGLGMNRAQGTGKSTRRRR